MLIELRNLLVSTCLIALAACNSGQSGPSADDVAATVDGTPISEKLLGSMLKQRSDFGRPVDAEARKAYLDRMILQLAVSQEAVRKGMDKRPEVAAKIELSRQSILVNALVEDYFKNNPISDDEIKAAYEKTKADEGSTEYKARHILVDAEPDAKDIIAKLKKDPKAFDSLAQQKSKDTGSKSKGGDLGWFVPKRMVPEFGAAVVKLQKGKFTQEPVKTMFGYHVILLDDSRPRVMESVEQYKDRLKPQLEQQKLQKVFDELKAKAKIDIVHKR